MPCQRQLPAPERRVELRLGKVVGGGAVVLQGRDGGTEQASCCSRGAAEGHHDARVVCVMMMMAALRQRHAERTDGQRKHPLTPGKQGKCKRQ